MTSFNLDTRNPNRCGSYGAGFDSLHYLTRLHPEEIMDGHRRFHEWLLRDTLLSESNDEH
jgi:hypothetical protein